MKLTTVALAAAFALSSTFAFAGQTSQHKYKSGVRTHQGTVGMSSRAQYVRPGRVDSGLPKANGLVGGADPGTYKP
jgi:hypothetical protein